MPSPYEVFLRPEPIDPPARVAGRLLRDHGATIPVPISQLASNYAEVQEEPWPFADCDGMVIGLHERSRPLIFLRSNQHFVRRRFTLAHELGHIRMAWHLGVTGCQPNERVREETRANYAADWRLIGPPIWQQEAEATRFASYTLLPERELREAVINGGIPELLMLIDTADVSTIACMIRLKQLLAPGFVFIHHDPQRQVICSDSTRMSADFRRGGSVEVLRGDAVDGGAVSVSGKLVEWFQLAQFDAFAPDEDPRRTREILHAAIAAGGLAGADLLAIERSINGVVSSALSSSAKGLDRDQTFGVVRHRCNDFARFGLIVGSPDFDIYLRRKVNEWFVKHRSQQ